MEECSDPQDAWLDLDRPHQSSNNNQRTLLRSAGYSHTLSTISFSLPLAFEHPAYYSSKKHQSRTFIKPRSGEAIAKLKPLFSILPSLYIVTSRLPLGRYRVRQALHTASSHPARFTVTPHVSKVNGNNGQTTSQLLRENSAISSHYSCRLPHRESPQRKLYSRPSYRAFNLPPDPFPLTSPTLLSFRLSKLPLPPPRRRCSPNSLSCRQLIPRPQLFGNTLSHQRNLSPPPRLHTDTHTLIFFRAPSHSIRLAGHLFLSRSLSSASLYALLFSKLSLLLSRTPPLLPNSQQTFRARPPFSSRTRVTPCEKSQYVCNPAGRSHGPLRRGGGARVDQMCGCFSLLKIDRLREGGKWGGGGEEYSSERLDSILLLRVAPSPTNTNMKRSDQGHKERERSQRCQGSLGFASSAHKRSKRSSKRRTKWAMYACLPR